MLERKVVFFVFRHGQTDWNLHMRWQGHTDVPLNERGLKEARSLIEPLKKLSPTHILSSDLGRAQQTASIVAQALDLKLTTHHGFRELGFGEAEGLTFDQIGDRFGSDAQKRIRSTDHSDLDFCFPGGESKRQLLTRTFRALDELVFHSDLLREHSIFGLSTHGGLIRTLLQHCGLKDRAQVTIPNASLFEFEYYGPQGPLLFKGKIDT